MLSLENRLNVVIKSLTTRLLLAPPSLDNRLGDAYIPLSARLLRRLERYVNALTSANFTGGSSELGNIASFPPDARSVRLAPW